MHEISAASTQTREMEKTIDEIAFQDSAIPQVTKAIFLQAGGYHPHGQEEEDF